MRGDLVVGGQTVTAEMRERFLPRRVRKRMGGFDQRAGFGVGQGHHGAPLGTVKR